MIFDSAKNETPFPQNNFNSDWQSTTPGWHSSSFKTICNCNCDSPLPQDATQAVSRQSDVELHNKSSPNLTFYLTCLWFLIALKMKLPVSTEQLFIQIDSPLPQDDTQAVSRESDVELHNKSSPKLTLYLICLWFWMALKIKVPASTEQFQFRLTVHYHRMPLKQFQDNLM